MSKFDLFCFSLVVFTVGGIAGSTLKDARAQRTDLVQRVQPDSQGPIATWWMYGASPADTVGRIQVNIGALCRAVVR